MSDGYDYDVIVVGGGPGGSTAAAVAAKAGLQVLLLEAASHPREKIGESMLPGITPILETIGALDAVRGAGFEVKTGATQWGFGSRDWDLWFRDTDEYETSWFVDRPIFDALLFDAAHAAGADVRQNTPALGPLLEGEGDAARIVGVRTAKEHLRARHVIDASGAAARVVGERTLRRTIEGLRHRAHYARWRSSERLPPPRNQQALFVGLNDAWIWCFPLGPDLRSVGLVELEDAPRRDYDATVRASTVGELLGANAERISPLRHARDWSYRCEHVAGPGWFAIGDAAGFIDPILSTGVLLAMHSGLAAANACAAIASGGSEADEKTSYADAHRSMFDDMLRIVRFYYEQNGDRDALFWESKRLLSGRVELKPQKAFMMLTSGLIGNLALEAARGEAPRSADDFVCVHLEERRGAEVAQLYWLIEGRSDEPALFQTRSFNLTCLAPRYNNDPIRLPELRAPLEALRGAIDDSDTGFESLTAWWSRGGREALRSALERLPPELRVRRVFGQ